MLSLFTQPKRMSEPSICDYCQSTSIAVRHLSVELSQRTILDDVSFELKKGEFTALLGPNGTGKSTLLKAITGEVHSHGDVMLFGRNKTYWPSGNLARHLGVLPQSSSLSFNFTSREVVSLGGIGLNMPNHQLEQLVVSNMEKTDVIHLADRSYPTLSGGEKQRVHLARVLTQLEQGGNNKILLLDEPTSALDLHHQHSTLALAKSLAKQGATVVAVLHDLNLAAQYADRLMILNKGNIVADAPPKYALKSDIIERVYQHKVSIIPHPELGHPVVIAA
ncbi:heme ABC transporter ATP-binding protein [Vibrio japonicus]|uniref:Heme ABC transporter ATP-binding protein n=1 Tax=Vibrio japonicus TaxID=1824638 RepID=A0ABY5LH42_9VIBR|nr:heme ABC transporter ATP-binding protein [Vibrio japonicus]UUM31363.1 heme ABC transporter ATP-binding protein [Vibrio japonicus]